MQAPMNCCSWVRLIWGKDNKNFRKKKNQEVDLKDGGVVDSNIRYTLIKNDVNPQRGGHSKTELCAANQSWSWVGSFTDNIYGRKQTWIPIGLKWQTYRASARHFRVSLNCARGFYSDYQGGYHHILLFWVDPCLSLTNTQRIYFDDKRPTCLFRQRPTVFRECRWLFHWCEEASHWQVAFRYL